MEWRRSIVIGLIVGAVSCSGFAAQAQTAAAPVGEELEPRVVGAAGYTTLGLSGFADKVSSSEDVFPWQATAHLELTRFISRRLAARIGLVGSLSADGLDDDERITPGAPAFYASSAVLFYVVPGSLISPYAGVEYRARLSERPEKDAGTAFGLTGVQATISSRASVFLEAGYGTDLTRGDDGELRTRFVSAIGVRIRF